MRECIVMVYRDEARPGWSASVPVRDRVRPRAGWAGQVPETSRTTGQLQGHGG